MLQSLQSHQIGDLLDILEFGIPDLQSSVILLSLHSLEFLLLEELQSVVLFVMEVFYASSHLAVFDPQSFELFASLGDQFVECRLYVEQQLLFVFFLFLTKDMRLDTDFTLPLVVCRLDQFFPELVGLQSDV